MEVNDLIGWSFVEVSPEVHLAHRDLTGGDGTQKSIAEVSAYGKHSLCF
jgi:hypothetical protein